MPKITGIDRKLIESTMRKAHIPGVSIAYRDGKSTIPSTTNIGTTDTRDTSILSKVEDDTVFGAASLSKPVFAYLVLKLIDKGVLSGPGKSAASGLDRPLHEVFSLEKFFHEHDKQLSEIDIERAKAITPRMLLSHTSGLGIDASATLSFAPGTEYAYSGMGLEYLQRVIKEQTGKSLGTLAQEHVFGELALDMKKSSFVPPGTSEDKADAANSLYTTASDYTKLMIAWMQDPSPIMQQAFVRQVSLTQDNQRLPGESNPAAEHVDMKVKECLAWGLGLGLELDETGKAVKAFHTGDMNQFRAQTALDLEKKSCIVYFANANSDLQANGHVLAPLIIKPKIPIDYAHTWFYSKFPFALKPDQLTEGSRFGLRVQGKDKKADSDAVMAAFMPGGAPTHVPNPDASDGSSYAVMRALMPTHSPTPALISPELGKQSSVESPPTTAIEEEIQAETDRPSSPSPFKLTPKPSGYS
ncbi:class A beta-lactamase-related serine hydrolase [Legionella pneumophila]|uniref:serine hydrolase domain-containing protein n=1 Tax=Legionella pneumophila TaxID=446 RepID=UPI00101E5515|nr:serine hydrolase domain-containing protein [Legionella pneumophila]RYW88250.1 class A beta-lactamase-related serine hydrolase [Legionella pneumophila]